MLKIDPAFGGNEIPVFFAFDRKYLPCMAVSLLSIIANTSEDRNYDIVLLHDGVAAEDLEKLQSMADGRKNISLRSFNASAEFENVDLYYENRAEFSKVTFYRLIIPWLMPDIAKAIYLDCDTLARTDIARLYDTPLHANFLAAVRDYCSIGNLFSKDRPVRNYRQTVLQMSEPENYFNSGVMVMNCEAFRNEFTAKQILDKAASYEWRAHDQDILNTVCLQRAELLDNRWSAFQVMEDMDSTPPGWLKARTAALKDPYLIHYVSEYKPWKYPRMKFSEEFWLLAARTPFYPELVDELCCNNRVITKRSSANTDMIDSFRNGDNNLRTLLKYLRAWVDFKLKIKRQYMNWEIVD